jgi:methionyl-tRNA formyltransferase
VRAFASSTGGFADIRGKRLKVWRTAPVDCEGEGPAGKVLSLEGCGPVITCAKGAIQLTEVQAEGKRRVGGGEWARGARLKAGDVL